MVYVMNDDLCDVAMHHWQDRKTKGGVRGELKRMKPKERKITKEVHNKMKENIGKTKKSRRA